MDKWLRLSEVALMANGELQGEDVYISGVSTDTRNLHFGDMFIALQGDKFDGHKFIDASIEQIVSGALVHKVVDTKLPLIMVENTLAGMTRWAQAWRRKVNPKLIAVTGSNGKTTVRQMISNVFNQIGSVCATQGNLNNQIGVPLTLLTMRKQNQFAVIELGANHHGEIHNLSLLTEPDVGVITNAGPAHLEGFGSIAGVAKGKGEIIDGISTNGVLVLNADDEYFDFWLQRARHLRVESFGFREDATIRGRVVSANCLVISTPTDEFEVTLPMIGKHNMYNALAATAASYALQVKVKDIQAGLQNTTQVSGRLQIKPGIMGSTVIDDTYNANPASLQAAINVLCTQSGEPWLVLGDMGELGENAEAIHAQMGEMARAAGVKRLFGLGELAEHAVTAFGKQGMHFKKHEELGKELLGQLNPDSCILVKGSRAMHMEDVVKILIQSAVVH